MHGKPVRTKDVDGEEGTTFELSTGDRVIAVCYDNTMNPRIMEILPVYVDAMLFMVPAWCRRLCFDFEHNASEGGDHTVSAYTTTQPDYLFAHITLSDAWLGESDWDRAFALMHEFVHLHESPLYHFARKALEELMAPGEQKPESQGKIIMQEYTAKYEAQTQEFAHMLMNKLWPQIKERLA